MPPSGYSEQQAGLVMALLESCAEELKKQALLTGRAMVEALRGECEDIRSQLADGNNDRFGRAVLQLTLAFYEDVMKMSPNDADEYDESVERVLKSVQNGVLAIHIA